MLFRSFIDDAGSYDALPERAQRGQSVRVAGEIAAPLAFGGVGIARIDPAQPLDAAALNRTSGYQMPEPYILFFPRGYQTPKPVQLDGARFVIDVPLDDARRAGRYEVSVWARPPGKSELSMVSLRVVTVR